MLEISSLDERFNRKILNKETLNMWEEYDFIESPCIEYTNIIKMGIKKIQLELFK